MKHSKADALRFLLSLSLFLALALFLPRFTFPKMSFFSPDFYSPFAPAYSRRAPAYGRGGYSPVAYPEELLYDPRARQAAALAEQRRRQQERQMQRELQRRVEEQRQQELRQAALRQLLVRRNHRAAAIIQRHWRSYIAKVRHERQQAAANVIVAALRRGAAVRRAKKIAASLHQLKAIALRIDVLCAQYIKAPRGYRNTLAFADSLEKQILLVDTVQAYSTDIVREKRKAVIAKAQGCLRIADFVLKTVLVRRAAILQRAVRAWRDRRHQAKRRQAAEIVRRTLLAAPRIKRAKDEAHLLRRLRQQQEQLAFAQAAYRAALEAALRVAEAALCSVPSTFAHSQAQAMLAGWQQHLANLPPPSSPTPPTSAASAAIHLESSAEDVDTNSQPAGENTSQSQEPSAADMQTNSQELKEERASDSAIDSAIGSDAECTTAV